MLSFTLMLGLLLAPPPMATADDIEHAVAVNGYYCSRIAGLATQFASGNHDADLAEASQLVEAAAQAHANYRLDLPIAADQQAEAVAATLLRRLRQETANAPSREVLERELVSCAQHL